MEKNLHNTEALQKMKSLAESVNICMYAMQEGGAGITARPMSASLIEDDGTVWFFTSDNSTAGTEAEGGKSVCLAFSSPAKNTYLSVSGTAVLSHDKAKMDELWSPMLKTWFPQGLETPDIALIRVTPQSAHYWDSDASRFLLLYSFVKASITGEPAHGSEGTEGQLNLPG